MHSNQAVVSLGIPALGHSHTPGGLFQDPTGLAGDQLTLDGVCCSTWDAIWDYKDRKNSAFTQHSLHSLLSSYGSLSKTETGGKDSQKGRYLVLGPLEMDVLRVHQKISLALRQIESFTVTVDNLSAKSQSPTKWLYEKSWEVELQGQRPLFKLMLLILCA